MATIYDLIEDWIQMRATLQRQLKLLEFGELDAGTSTEITIIRFENTEATVARLRNWVDELNSLLMEHSSADRT